MELIAKERDRLLQRTARFIGIAGTLLSLTILSIPGVVAFPTLVGTLPLFALLIGAHVMVGRSLSIWWSLLGISAGIGILVVVQVPFDVAPSVGLPSALSPLAGAGMGCFALALLASFPRLVVLVTGAAVSTLLVERASNTVGVLSASGLAVILGWVLTAVLGYWLSASVPRAARRIYAIGKAHRAERQASETEAQRRQSARLLHDTVLATLTLLAHSGVGVAPAALKQQAADDARLLRQLRLGATPMPMSSGSYNLEAAAESVLGTTLESVKQRFGRMGLEVSWHGTGQVLLPSDVLDAFLLSLAECLENVRRHSGVTQAHVTITDDVTTVRAMVTDSGVGFDLDGIDEDKLGFKESVVGRLREVGGNARLFSSPGSGTTVVLEVPQVTFVQHRTRTPSAYIFGRRNKTAPRGVAKAVRQANARAATLGTGYLGIGAACARRHPVALRHEPVRLPLGDVPERAPGDRCVGALHRQLRRSLGDDVAARRSRAATGCSQSSFCCSPPSSPSTSSPSGRSATSGSTRRHPSLRDSDSSSSSPCEAGEKWYLPPRPSASRSSPR